MGKKKRGFLGSKIIYGAPLSGFDSAAAGFTSAEGCADGVGTGVVSAVLGC